MWLRVESFWRSLAGSEAHHAEETAKPGALREYTAWGWRSARLTPLVAGGCRLGGRSRRNGRPVAAVGHLHDDQGAEIQ